MIKNFLCYSNNFIVDDTKDIIRILKKDFQDIKNLQKKIFVMRQQIDRWLLKILQKNVIYFL